MTIVYLTWRDVECEYFATEIFGTVEQCIKDIMKRNAVLEDLAHQLNCDCDILVIEKKLTDLRSLVNSDENDSWWTVEEIQEELETVNKLKMYETELRKKFEEAMNNDGEYISHEKYDNYPWHYEKKLVHLEGQNPSNDTKN